MLLNIRLSLLKETGSQFFFIAVILAINFIAQLFFLFQVEFTSLIFFKTSNVLESTTFLEEIFSPMVEIQSENTMKNLGFIVYVLLSFFTFKFDIAFSNDWCNCFNSSKNL
jgi:hypothetical protein